MPAGVAQLCGCALAAAQKGGRVRRAQVYPLPGRRSTERGGKEIVQEGRSSTSLLPSEQVSESKAGDEPAAEVYSCISEGTDDLCSVQIFRTKDLWKETE